MIPNDEQLQALKDFAAANGRYWKQNLRHCWETGLYSHYKGTDRQDLLQQVRNSFGPTWLMRFSLTSRGTDFDPCECGCKRGQHFNSRGQCNGYKCRCIRFVKRTRQFDHMEMMKAALSGDLREGDD